MHTLQTYNVSSNSESDNLSIIYVHSEQEDFEPGN